MAKRFIIIFILLCTALIDINLLIAKTDEEIKYQIRLEKRQEYCSNNHIVFFYSQDFIQPFEDIDPKNINSVSELYCMATFYEDEGKLDAAMQNYLEILSLAPNFIDIIIKVGDFYKNYDYSDKDYNLAVFYYRNALKLIDNYLTYDITFLDPYIDVYNKIIYSHNEMCVPEVRVGLSKVYWAFESISFPTNMADCIDVTWDDIYLDIDSNYFLRYLYIVPSDLDKCGFNRYINIYDELLNKLDGMLKNPDLNAVKDKITGYEIQFLLEKAAKLNNNDKTNEAIKIYEELYPDSIIAIKKLGEIYESLGYLNEAKDILEYGEANIKDFKDTYEIKDYVLKSKIYFNLGENYYDNALLALNIAINKIEKDFYETNLYEISSSSFENLIRNDVITQYKILNFECYSSYRDVIAPNKTNADAYYYRGRIYYAQGSCNKAKQDFETAYKIYQYGEQATWVNVKCK